MAYGVTTMTTWLNRCLVLTAFPLTLIRIICADLSDAHVVWKAQRIRDRNQQTVVFHRVCDLGLWWGPYQGFTRLYKQAQTGRGGSRISQNGSCMHARNRKRGGCAYATAANGPPKLFELDRTRTGSVSYDLFCITNNLQAIKNHKWNSVICAGI